MKNKIIFLNIRKRKQNEIKEKKGKIRMKNTYTQRRKEGRKANIAIKKEGKKVK